MLEGPLCNAILDDQSTIIKLFEKRHSIALEYVAKSIGMLPICYGMAKVKKINIAEALVNWCEHQQEIPLPTLPDILDEIRADIKEMKTPSWVESAPANLGDSSHRKLKAAQWQSLGTVYLPASLIRLWGTHSSSDSNSERQYHIVQATMSLVLLSAISVATANTMSNQRAELYAQHLQAYIDSVKKLFPDHKFRPNHHMAFHIAKYLKMYGPV